MNIVHVQENFNYLELKGNYFGKKGAYSLITKLLYLSHCGKNFFVWKIIEPFLYDLGASLCMHFITMKIIWCDVLRVFWTMRTALTVDQIGLYYSAF